MSKKSRVKSVRAHRHDADPQGHDRHPQRRRRAAHRRPRLAAQQVRKRSKVTAVGTKLTPRDLLRTMVKQEDSAYVEEMVTASSGKKFLVAYTGDRKKPAIVTFHDLGLNYISNFQVNKSCFVILFWQTGKLTAFSCSVGVLQLPGDGGDPAALLHLPRERAGSGGRGRGHPRDGGVPLHGRPRRDCEFYMRHKTIFRHNFTLLLHRVCST